jgi:hypothetical protein
MRPKDCGKDSLAYWARSEPVTVIDIDPTYGPNLQSIGTAFVNGTKIRVMFDTGAPASMLTLRAAARAGVKPDDPGVVPAGATFGIGRELQARR